MSDAGAGLLLRQLLLSCDAWFDVTTAAPDTQLRRPVGSTTKPPSLWGFSMNSAA
jgi:hypothetical protein